MEATEQVRWVPLGQDIGSQERPSGDIEGFAVAVGGRWSPTFSWPGGTRPRRPGRVRLGISLQQEQSSSLSPRRFSSDQSNESNYSVKCRT